MYLAREITGASLPAIGREFGGRDHTTVLHACRRASARLASEDGSRAGCGEAVHRPWRGRRVTAAAARSTARLRDFHTPSTGLSTAPAPETRAGQVHMSTAPTHNYLS